VCVSTRVRIVLAAPGPLLSNIRLRADKAAKTVVGFTEMTSSVEQFEDLTAAFIEEHAEERAIALGKMREHGVSTATSGWQMERESDCVTIPSCWRRQVQKSKIHRRHAARGLGACRNLHPRRRPRRQRARRHVQGRSGQGGKNGAGTACLWHPHLCTEESVLVWHPRRRVPSSKQKAFVLCAHYHVRARAYSCR
jgi:hypothetical protein